MLRRRFVAQSAVGAVSALAFPSVLLGTATAESKRKPNLLVFLPDQQRADTIAPYGNGRCHAPHLNRLAAQSTVFDRCYVTHPVCTPSRSSLLTGTWPHTNGCTHNNMALAPRWKTFPEMLGDTDYRTAYMGKWHLGDEVFAQRGFEEWASIEDMYQAYFGAGRDPTTISDYSKFLLSRGVNSDSPDGSVSRKFASTLPIELSKPRFLEERACEFLERHRRDPFVLFVSFLEPHSPYQGPLNREHRDDEIEFEPTARTTFGADIPLRYRLKQEYLEREFGTGPDDYRETKRNYYGLVTQIDRSIGGILGKLESLGLADDTVVVHTSDHGDMMGHHRLFEKEVMFDAASRVPYLVRLPGQKRSQRVAQPVSHIDFVPTMLDLLGAKPHAQCIGRSRAPLLRGERMPAETVFLEWSPNSGKEKVKKGTTLATADAIARASQESTRTAVSPDGWKLNLRNTDQPELYNLLADPLETQNLFDAAACADVRKRITADIAAWQKHTDDSVKLTT
ncbi:MAG: sulfatase-like hydrolase/transferase [Opitutaceae bacterium]